MEKQVLIEDVRGGVTSGYTSEDVKIGDTATITGKDENGAAFNATGKVIEIIEQSTNFRAGRAIPARINTMKHGLLITKRGIAMVACGENGMELRFDEVDAVEYCKQHNHEFIGFNPRLSAFVAEKSRKIKE